MCIIIIISNIINDIINDSNIIININDSNNDY